MASVGWVWGLARGLLDYLVGVLGWASFFFGGGVGGVEGVWGPWGNTVGS